MAQFSQPTTGMWSELFQSRLAEHQATRTVAAVAEADAFKESKETYENGLSNGEYALKKHQIMMERAKYIERLNKKKKGDPVAKPTILVNAEELEKNMEEHEAKKPWSRLRVMAKKAKIREYFRLQGWAEPAEEWLFDVTNKKLPDVVIVYDTEKATIVSIKGMGIK